MKPVLHQLGGTKPVQPHRVGRGEKQLVLSVELFELAFEDFFPFLGDIVLIKDQEKTLQQVFLVENELSILRYQIRSPVFLTQAHRACPTTSQSLASNVLANLLASHSMYNPAHANHPQSCNPDSVQ